DAAAESQRDPVAGVGVRIGSDLVHPSPASATYDHGFRVKDMQFPGGEPARHYPGRAALIDQDVHHLKLVQEADFVLDALLVKRLQDHVAGAIGCVASPAHWLAGLAFWLSP